MAIVITFSIKTDMDIMTILAIKTNITIVIALAIKTNIHDYCGRPSHQNQHSWLL